MKLTIPFIAFVFFFICSVNVFAQEETKMKVVLNKISYDGVTISIKEAQQLAEGKSPRAYQEFRKAQKMNNWNFVWSFLGGYEVGAGIGQVAFNDNPIGFLDMALGGILISIPHSKGRKQRQLMYVKLGVEEYNKIE